jgi:hypothetical protein
MRINRQLQWGLVFFVTLTAIISRLKFNGLVLNFDYGIYQPDGSHYTYRTLTFLGVDSNAAAERVVNWYQFYGVKHNVFLPSFLTPETSGGWGLSAPRVLYPFLSAPFVYLFGIPGMLVIPAASLVLLVFCVYRMSELKGKQPIGFLLVLVLCTSPTVLRWMIANITDSLLAALFAVVALLLMSKTTLPYWYLGMSILIVSTSITRFSLPIWIGISVVLWINRMRRQSLWVFVLSAISFLPTFLYMPSNAILPANAEEQNLTKLVLLAKSFFSVGFIEVAQLGALDRTLLALIVIALAISLRYPCEISSKYFLAVLLAVWAIGAINGTLGVNFRYQMPLLGFASWVILSNSSQFTDWFGRSRINVIRKKT